MVNLLSRIEGYRQESNKPHVHPGPTSDPLPLISRIGLPGLFNDSNSSSMPAAATNGHVPSSPASSSTSPSYSLDESRQSLGSILFNNAKRRKLPSDEATIRDRIAQLVTDEVWDSFSKNLSEIRKQLGEYSQRKASFSDSVENGSQKPVPSAPRAMVNHERIRVLEDLLKSATKEDLLKIITRPIPPDSSSPNIPSVQQTTAEIPIPIDDSMFVKLPSRSSGKPASPSVSPSQSSSFSSTRKRHILPPPRSPSPLARNWRYSPSRSPSGRGRSASVSPRRRDDKPSPYRSYDYRRISRSPPVSRRSRRGRSRRGRPRSPYSYRTNGYQRVSRFSRSPDLRHRSISPRSEVNRSRRVSGSTSISSLSYRKEGGVLSTQTRQNDKPQSAEISERRHALQQSESQIPSSGPPSKVNDSLATTLPLPLHHSDEPEHEIVPLDYLQPEKEANDIQMQNSSMVSDNIQKGDIVTKLVSQDKPSLGKDSIPVPQPFPWTQLTKSHSCVAPGIWWAHPGASNPNIILPAKIEVHLNAESLKHMQVTLTCLPTELVASVLSSVPESSLLQEGSDILFKIDPHWPKKGSLLVEVNGHGFFPRDMDPDIPSPLLDITLSMKPGSNIIQIIQLSDNAERMFLILASPASQADKELESLFDAFLASQSLQSSESLLDFDTSVVVK